MQKEEEVLNILVIAVSHCRRGFTNSATILKVKLLLVALL